MNNLTAALSPQAENRQFRKSLVILTSASFPFRKVKQKLPDYKNYHARQCPKSPRPGMGDGDSVNSHCKTMKSRILSLQTKCCGNSLNAQQSQQTRYPSSVISAVGLLSRNTCHSHEQQPCYPGHQATAERHLSRRRRSKRKSR